MALAALIAAYHESDEPGGALRAVLPLAGRTLIERQARLAAAAGVSRIFVAVERVPAELLAAIDRLRRDGLQVTIARTAGEAADVIDAADPLLLIADGFIGDEAHLRRLADGVGPSVLTVADTQVDDRFERIDAESRWAGLALIDGAMLRRTAAMLHDWDLQSTLLRQAVQSQARQVALRGEPADAQLTIVERASDLVDVQRRILDGAGTGRGEWVSRYLLAPVERAATHSLMPGAATPEALGFAAAALTAFAVIAFAKDVLWLGMAFMLLSTPLDGIADRLARLRMQGGVGQSWWSHLLPALAGAALLALGFSLSQTHSWGTILMSATIILFLLALRFEGEGRELKGAEFLAERKAMVWLMLPFAATGLWVGGLSLLFAYSAGSFFFVQRRLRVPSVPHRD